MRFALLDHDRVTGAVRLAKRGTYTDCLAASRVLTVRFALLAVVWAVKLTPDFAEVTEEECPGLGAAAGPRKSIRQKFAELDDLGDAPPATPENAGERFATRPFLRMARPSAN